MSWSAPAREAQQAQTYAALIGAREADADAYNALLRAADAINWHALDAALTENDFSMGQLTHAFLRVLASWEPFNMLVMKDVLGGLIQKMKCRWDMANDGDIRTMRSHAEFGRFPVDSLTRDGLFNGGMIGVHARAVVETDTFVQESVEIAADIFPSFGIVIPPIPPDLVAAAAETNLLTVRIALKNYVYDIPTLFGALATAYPPKADANRVDHEWIILALFEAMIARRDSITEAEKNFVQSQVAFGSDERGDIFLAFLRMLFNETVEANPGLWALDDVFDRNGIPMVQDDGVQPMNARVRT